MRLLLFCVLFALFSGAQGTLTQNGVVGWTSSGAASTDTHSGGIFVLSTPFASSGMIWKFEFYDTLNTNYVITPLVLKRTASGGAFTVTAIGQSRASTGATGLQTYLFNIQSGMNTIIGSTGGSYPQYFFGFHHGTPAANGGPVAHYTSSTSADTFLLGYNKAPYVVGTSLGTPINLYQRYSMKAYSAYGCLYDSLSYSAGTTCNSVGCYPGDVQEPGLGCSFFRDGYSCTPKTCNTGTYTWSGGNVVSCTADPCEFDSLVLPSGASATGGGTGCAASGLVTSGASCAVTKSGYTCTSATCSLGQWTNAVSCTGQTCSGTGISVPSGATVSGTGCGVSGQVASGTVCTYTLGSHTCSQTCRAGSWSTAPSCSGDVPECHALTITRVANANGYCGYHLVGSYTFTGTLPECGSILKWYLATSLTGAGKTLIPEATGSNSYNPQVTDVGKYIIFEVTPSNCHSNGTPCQRFGFYIGLIFGCNGVVGPRILSNSRNLGLPMKTRGHARFYL